MCVCLAVVAWVLSVCRRFYPSPARSIHAHISNEWKTLAIVCRFNLFFHTCWRRRWPMFSIFNLICRRWKPLKRFSRSSPSDSIGDCGGVRKCNCRYWIDLSGREQCSSLQQNVTIDRILCGVISSIFLFRKCQSWRKSLSSQWLLIWSEDTLDFQTN